MSGSNPENTGWFTDLDPGDLEAAAITISDGTADRPRKWPKKAIESGFATDENDYYEALHQATVHATRRAVSARETAGDQQLQYAVRAMDDKGRYLLYDGMNWISIGLPTASIPQ
ncbi:hypothetical protein [Halobellus marinus]|uniref:hypothetical protein n=1 Tax=Halobellus TaxID=1073986 RepID=UPI0028AB1CE8|nr:hypothetical protein [Halobellus sp. DFY28]